MVAVTRSVTIDKPADEVWQYLSNLQNRHVIDHGLHAVERNDDGSVTMVRKLSGMRLEIKGHVRADQEGRQQQITGHVKSRELDIPTDQTDTVSDNGNGTSTVQSTVSVDMAAFPDIVAGHLQKVLAHDVESALDRLQHHFEAPDEYHDQVRKHFHPLHA